MLSCIHKKCCNRFALGNNDDDHRKALTAERAGNYFLKTTPQKTQLHHRCIDVSRYPKYAFGQSMTSWSWECQGGKNRISHKQRKNFLMWGVNLKREVV